MWVLRSLGSDGAQSMAQALGMKAGHAHQLGLGIQQLAHCSPPSAGRSAPDTASTPDKSEHDPEAPAEATHEEAPGDHEPSACSAEADHRQEEEEEDSGSDLEATAQLPAVRQMVPRAVDSESEPEDDGVSSVEDLFDAVERHKLASRAAVATMRKNVSSRRFTAEYYERMWRGRWRRRSEGGGGASLHRRWRRRSGWR